MLLITDIEYINILHHVYNTGDFVTTRNSITKSSFNVAPVTFTSTPLVTLRKTAWKKALTEYEWFMSGDSKCPEVLSDWWKGQLSVTGDYLAGYGTQMRHFQGSFDQVEFLLKGIKNNPNSRRLVMTCWNPKDMASITEINNNPLTPTTCHSTYDQYFVRDGKLHLKTFQRSADLLLGLSHNFIQKWAILLYFSHHCNLEVGSLQYNLGDAHIYWEDSHIQATQELINCITLPVSKEDKEPFELVYNYSGEVDYKGLPKFLTKDFTIVGTIPEPIVKVKPKLL